jgi:hypothetical protein
VTVLYLNLSSFGNLFPTSEGNIANTFTQIKAHDQFVTEPKNISDAFANHLMSIVNTSCPTDSAPQSLTTDLLPVAPVSAVEVSKAMKRLKLSKLFGLGGIKGCSDIFVPLLTYIFNPSVASETLPSLWRETAIVPVLMFTF